MADLFTKTGRVFLGQLDLDEAGRTILDRYLETMDQIHQAVDESTASLRELMRRPRWSKAAALLMTMPGIGLITALTILAELVNLNRFRSRAAVANYAGLVPVVRDSNQKHYSGGISHRGSNHLRAVLGEAAWMAVPRVPVYRHLFERVARKKNKATAIVAVARRMLEDAFRRRSVIRYTIRHWVGCGNTGSDVALAVYLVSLRALSSAATATLSHSSGLGADCRAARAIALSAFTSLASQ